MAFLHADADFHCIYGMQRYGPTERAVALWGMKLPFLYCAHCLLILKLESDAPTGRSGGRCGGTGPLALSLTARSAARPEHKWTDGPSRVCVLCPTTALLGTKDRQRSKAAASISPPAEGSSGGARAWLKRSLLGRGGQVRPMA